MSTAAHRAAPARTPHPESPYTGVAALVRFIVRRDRMRLGIWVAALTAMMAYSPNALTLAYPEEAQRRARVELLKTPAGMMLGGPMFGRNETELGAMMANELMLTLIVATSIMAVLTVVRHTRADEEAGAAEIVLASVVGRHARTAAALVVVAGVSAVLTVTMTAAMVATGFGVVDSAAMCLGVAAVALVFGAVAAVTAQLWRQARTATGAALAALAAAVLIRGVGDTIDHSGSALSWFSPIAWAQQMRPFVELRWWPLALLVLLAVTIAASAGVLENRRQYDDGTLRSSGERPGAPRIGGVFGLHVTLQRGLTVGWAVGLFVAGAAVGSMTRSMLDAAQDNEMLRRVLGAQGTDGVYTSMTQFLAAAATAYVVAAVLRLIADERSGVGEAVLAGAVSRTRWLLSAVAATLLGATVLMAAAGFGNGLGAGLTLGEPGTVVRLTAAGLAHLPALALVTAVAALAVAVRRPALGWLTVTFVVTSLYLGALLRLPQWLLDASPVGQIRAPSEYSVAASTVMLVVAAALILLAAVIYRRRDAV